MYNVYVIYIYTHKYKYNESVEDMIFVRFEILLILKRLSR